MENQQSPYDDEIDLKKYIDVILKRKLIILSLFFVAIIIAAAAVSLAPKTYKATASIKIAPEQAVLLSLNDVLQRLVKKLDLPQSPEWLAKKLSVKKVAETNEAILSVTDTDPQAAQKIVNALAEDMTTPLVRDARGLSSFDLGIKKSLLNGYKNEFAALDPEIKRMEDLLAELKKQIASQEKIIVLSTAVLDYDSGDKIKNLRSEVINPVYQDLNMRIVNTEIELYTKKLRAQDLMKIIGPMEDEIHAEANRIITPASAPVVPEDQGGGKKMILVGMLSLVFGVFLAFFMEFWQKLKENR